MSHSRPPPPYSGHRERMSPYTSPSPRPTSPGAWGPSPPAWQGWNGSPPAWPPRNGSPSVTMGGPYSSPNGYWGSPRQWTPKRCHPSPNCREKWGSGPTTPFASPQHTQRQAPGSHSGERRHRISQAGPNWQRDGSRDASHYYKPSMMEDPWAALQGAATRAQGTS